MSVVRLGAACLTLLAVAGCDSTGTGVVSLDDVLVVDLFTAEPPTIRFETEQTHGCFTPIAYRARTTAASLSVVIDGLAVEDAPACRAITTSQFRLSLPQPFDPDFRIEIEHWGETDVYRVRSTEAGLDLVAVRTSTTRLGPR